MVINNTIYDHYVISSIHKLKQKNKQDFNQWLQQIQARMGNQQQPIAQPQPPSSSNNLQQQPQQQKLNLQACIIQLRLITERILKQFRFFGENVREFQKFQLDSKRASGIRRGDNFQGRVNQRGQVVGLGKYYKFMRSQCVLFFGECKNGIPVGRGINIRAFTMSRLDQKRQVQLDEQQFQAFMSEQWTPNKDHTQNGKMLKISHKKTYFFKGLFKEGQLYKGLMTIKQDNQIKMHYEGTFINNDIQGYGILQIPQKYKYRGDFLYQKKNGFGEEVDYVRKTYYVGEFRNDKREGYGELTYIDRENVKLKAFWTAGIIEPGQGVYVKSNGVFLEAIADDLLLL